MTSASWAARWATLSPNQPAGPDDAVLDEVGDLPPRELADAGRCRRDRVGLDRAGQHEVVVGAVEHDVVGELAQHRDSALACGHADDHDPGVGEIARHLGLDATDRPFLEDVG